MLAIAKKYEKEFQDKYLETWYDMRYQYYRDTSGDRIPQLADNCYDRRDFVSLDENGNVIGFISYFYDDTTRTASRFGIINFGESSYIFAKDVLQVIADIFFKFKLDRVEFWCFADNPARKGYQSFIKRFGGIQAGYLRRTCRLMDGELHDSVTYEVCREDLTYRNLMRGYWLGDVPVFKCMPELAYQTSYRDDETLEEDFGHDNLKKCKFVNVDNIDAVGINKKFCPEAYDDD